MEASYPVLAGSTLRRNHPIDDVYLIAGCEDSAWLVNRDGSREGEWMIRRIKVAWCYLKGDLQKSRNPIAARFYAVLPRGSTLAVAGFGQAVEDEVEVG